MTISAPSAEQLFDALEAAIDALGRKKLDDDADRINRTLERGRIRKACKQLEQLEKAIAKLKKVTAAEKRTLLGYVERLEAYCRMAPFNWFNFYDFWQ